MYFSLLLLLLLLSLLSFFDNIIILLLIFSLLSLLCHKSHNYQQNTLSKSVRKNLGIFLEPIFPAWFNWDLDMHQYLLPYHCVECCCSPVPWHKRRLTKPPHRWGRGMDILPFLADLVTYPCLNPDLVWFIDDSKCATLLDIRNPLFDKVHKS